MTIPPCGRAYARPRTGGLLHRLRERGVIRVAGSYAVIAWLVLQIASVVLEPLGAPKWAMAALIMAAAIGFPIAIALAWFLEIGDQGVQVDTAAEGVPRANTRGLRHYADAVVIGVLLVAVAVLLVRQSDLGRPKPPENPAIAVLPFENLSGDPEQEYFADGLAEETLDRLGRVPGLKVIARSSSFGFKGKDVQYAPTDLELDPLDMGFVVQRRYEAIDDPEDVYQDSDGTWHIKAGARVRVKLTMVADNRRYHVALVDPLPAGLEIDNPALAISQPIPRDPNNPEYRYGWWWWGPWYEHQNMRDDRAEAFTSLLWEGVYEYTYTARATTPGTFVVPPSRAEEMYSPEVFGRSGSDRVIVE